MNMRIGLLHAVLIMGLWLLSSCGEQGGEGPIVPPPPAPAEYADKHMPAGWWGDVQKLEEGRKLFLGETNPDVNCASCHGKDGKPVKAGATDFRRPGAAGGRGGREDEGGRHSGDAGYARHAQLPDS